jgi:hypothetical protein
MKERFLETMKRLNERFIPIPAWLIMIDQFTGNDYRVLIAIASHDDDHEPSLREIVEQTSMSQSTIRRTIKRLVDMNVLIIETDENGKKIKTDINGDTLVEMGRIALENAGMPKYGFRMKGSSNCGFQSETIKWRTFAEFGPKRPESFIGISPTKENKYMLHKTSCVTHSGHREEKRIKNEQSIRLAELWYDKTPPTEKHSKKDIIKKWAEGFDIAQKRSGYTDAQMLQAVEYRNGSEYWSEGGGKSCRPPSLGVLRHGARRIVTIYEQSEADRLRKKDKPNGPIWEDDF